MTVLWHAEKDNRKVFMHCMAGRNRSVTVVDCYYFLRMSEHRKDKSPDVEYGRLKNNQLLLNIQDNQLPGIFRMELFLERCCELFNDSSLADNASIDWLKKESFYS